MTPSFNETIAPKDV